MSWIRPPADLTLSQAEVHLWRVGLDQPAAQVQQLLQTLAPDERLRAGRFHFERDYRRFIVGRGALRAILGRYLDLKPAQVRFSYGPQGKPALLGKPAPGERWLCFNLAHSAELALYAVASDREIGVDLEYIRPVVEMEHIAERFFSTQERAALRLLPPDRFQAAFFNCWTLKEAYLKAIGTGLARPLDQFDLSFALGELPRLWQGVDQPEFTGQWSLWSLTPAPNYIAALAVAGPTGRLKYWQWG